MGVLGERVECAYDALANRLVEALHVFVGSLGGVDRPRLLTGGLVAHESPYLNLISSKGYGNTTKLPASDSGEYELTSSYYVDGQVASQTQNGETIKYFYDPAGRTREAVSTGKTAATTISHYAGPGASLMWTSEGSEKWTRNIPGIDGALDAVQKSGEAAVLQLHDLKGDIVGPPRSAKPKQNFYRAG